MQSSSDSDIAGGSPGELDVIAINICASRLSVSTSNVVTVGHGPAAGTLGLIMSKVTFEERSVRVQPLASNNLALVEFTNILLSSLEENVGALSILLSIGPVARVDIFIEVGHDTFTVTVTTLPVAVVVADILVILLADTVLHVVNPRAGVLDGLL